MKDIIDLLKEQNQLTSKHTKLFESHLGEFRRILQLQAAEAKVSNARTALIDEALQKILTEVSSLSEHSKKLIDELKL